MKLTAGSFVLCFLLWLASIKWEGPVRFLLCLFSALTHSSMLCSHDWFKGYMASQMGKDMRAMVGRSWGRSLARGDLEGARRAEVLHAFTEEASSGSKEEGSNS